MFLSLLFISYNVFRLLGWIISVFFYDRQESVKSYIFSLKAVETP